MISKTWPSPYDYPYKDRRRDALSKIDGKRVYVRSLKDKSIRPHNSNVSLYIPIPEYGIALWCY